MEKRFHEGKRFVPHKYEVDFGAGVPKRTERRNRDDVFIYPEEVCDKKCGGCVRFTSNNDGFPRGEYDINGYHCSMRGWALPIRADDKACVSYWDRAEYERSEREHEEAVEKRRRELWAVYAEREPVKLPIVNDGYGIIPSCPTCGEMPYGTEQCHWCGQRFIQDEEITEYAKPKLIDWKCRSCGTVGKAGVSKYNGHKSFRCAKCGAAWME